MYFVLISPDFNHFIVPLKNSGFSRFGVPPENDLITASCSLTTSHSSGILPRGESLNLCVSSFLICPFSSMPLVSKSCIRPCCIRLYFSMMTSVFSMASSAVSRISAILRCSGRGGIIMFNECTLLLFKPGTALCEFISSRHSVSKK